MPQPLKAQGGSLEEVPGKGRRNYIIIIMTTVEAVYYVIIFTTYTNFKHQHADILSGELLPRP
jgi:hypothetical protein